MSLFVDIQRESQHPTLPADSEFELWVAKALAGRRDEAELSIRLVDDAESAELNQRYRHKSGPTNVLSFPADLPDLPFDLPLLGDLVICAPLVEREALAQNKRLEAHWAHLTLHGCLHLLGHDHIDPQEAEVMERIERQLMLELNYDDPYAQDEE